MKQYAVLLSAKPGWQEIVRSFRFTHALLPGESPLKAPWSRPAGRFIQGQSCDFAGGPLNGSQEVLVVFIGAWASAALLTWFLYASTKAPRVEKSVAIQAAAHDMPAGTRLRKGDLKNSACS